MAADKPVHRHSQLVGAKLILLTLLDAIFHGNNQFSDVSTFSLHATSQTKDNKQSPSNINYQNINEI